MPKFSHEVFVSDASLAPLVSREMKGGRLRKLGSRVYTTNLKERPELLVRRHMWFLVEGLFPGALIADRTALEHRPTPDGTVFIISTKKRPVQLPGLSICPRKGEPPLQEDKPFMGGLYLSCPARAYLENLRPTRIRRGAESRTLSRQKIEENLENLLQIAGVEALQTLRDEARKIALLLHAEKEFKALDALIGTLLGTRKAVLISSSAIARSQGALYDAKRLERFQNLYEALMTSVSVPRPAPSNTGTALPFFEAYFSNFIEGTEFGVDEAASIVFRGKIPKDRPADAHDIIGTYALTSDTQEMHRIPQTSDELISLLRKRHAQLMHGRPDMRPGEFKRVPNQAGSTLFVAPELVEGTLRQGFQWLRSLDTPFKRAVYMMFLIAEVHPFADGNGRCGRIMMNAELIAASEMRIIVPTIFRTEYLSALKALTHNAQATPLIRSLSFAHNYTSKIDWSDYKKAKQMLMDTHAFEDSQQADLDGVRLILP